MPINRSLKQNSGTRQSALYLHREFGMRRSKAWDWPAMVDEFLRMELTSQGRAIAGPGCGEVIGDVSWPAVHAPRGCH